VNLAVGIIGGGAVGLASALHLARAGVSDVTVLEAEHVASGSSGLSAGIVETQYVEPLDIELRVASMRFFIELERDHGLDIVHNGYLRLAHSEDAGAAFVQSAELQRELGVADARVLSPEAIRRLAPDMRTDDVVAGLFGGHDGYLDGHTYCALLGDLASDLGVRVLTRHRIRAATVDSSGRHVLSTTRGEFEFDHVVVAAGAWSARVAEILGVEMPLLPQRHQAVVVHLPRALDYVMPSVMDYTPRSGVKGLFFRHEREDQLLAGLHSEEALGELVDPDRYARSADLEFLETVAELLSVRLPTLEDASLAHGWAGLYPVSPDGVPQVGPAPGSETIFLAGGAGGSGIQLSPVMGALLADWVVHGEPRAVPGAIALAPDRESLRTPPRPSAEGDLDPPAAAAVD